MSESEFDKTQILDRPSPGPSPAGRKGVLRCVDTSVLKTLGGAEIRLNTGEVTLGRGSENTIALDANGISRVHARLFRKGEAWQVEDLGSTNGTRVNNSLIKQATLNDGDTVAFGRVCYKFHILERTGAGGSTGGIDLGAADQTLVMRPGERPPIEPPAAPAREPGAEQIYDSGTHRRPVVKTPAADDTRTAGKGVMIGVVLLLLAAAGTAAAWFLGII